MKSDMLEQLFASGVMDPDRLKRKLINDDFFLDRTGIFGEKGKKYNIQLPKDQINFAHTRFTNLQDLTPPPAPPKTEGRYVPPTSNLGVKARTIDRPTGLHSAGFVIGLLTKDLWVSEKIMRSWSQSEFEPNRIISVIYSR